MSLALRAHTQTVVIGPAVFALALALFLASHRSHRRSEGRCRS